MRCVVKTVVSAGTLFLLLVTPLAAQTDDDKLKSLLQDLDALIEKGAAQKLADPWFLQDLRGLSARYGEVWPVVLMNHQFDSKGALPKAPWQVRQGEMRMDWSRGLRSRVEAASAGAAKTDKEVMGEIVGSLLGQALGTRGTQGGQRPVDPTTPALAEAALAVTNAFQLQAEISQRSIPGADRGGLELGVTQAGRAGYRLVMVPKPETGAVFTLIAVSARGSQRVVDSADYAEAIAEDQPYRLTLSRRPDGVMSAAIGDHELFAASDQSFRSAFDGLLIANRGGDYAVKSLTLRGTP